MKHWKFKQCVALKMLCDNNTEISSLATSMVDLFNIFLSRDEHQPIRVIPKGQKRVYCVWRYQNGRKCRNLTNNACNSCNQHKEPMYLCGLNMEEHRELEATRAMQNL